MSNPKTPTKIDWSTLRRALIVLTMSIILSIILLFTTKQYHNDISKWTQTQRSHFGAVEKKYTQIQAALEIVNGLYLKKFNQLIKEGFFSPNKHLNIEEQRLKMFKKIQTHLSQLPLFTADYALSETKLYTVPEFLTIDEQLKTYQTQLTLKLELLHEEDVLKLIKVIEFQKFAGLLNLHRCDIKRLVPKIDVKDISKPYINATCVLTRYTSSIEKDD
jgi:hypothetical protein